MSHLIDTILHETAKASIFDYRFMTHRVTVWVVTSLCMYLGRYECIYDFFFPPKS